MDYMCLVLCLVIVAPIAADGRSRALLASDQHNKLVVKTIKTEYGDIYDCMDLYKQPAFNHPLLKDHKIQMKPKFGKQADWESKASEASSTASSGLKEECPTGTVPIRRATKEELAMEKLSFEQHFHHQHDALAGKEGIKGFVFAGVTAGATNATKYTGVGGYPAVYGPSVGLGDFSASVMSIESGPIPQFSSIRVGWMVNPSLFKDNFTRLYTIWGQGDNGVMHGCYNTYCPGFVQVDTTIALGMVLQPLSVVNRDQQYIKVTVNQDQSTKNWWLTFGENDANIGYWPSSLFSSGHLNEGAELVRWGGMVYSSSPKLPAMGNGDNGDLSCPYKRLNIKLQTGSSFDGSSSAPLEAMQTKCYKVGDNSYKDNYWGYSFRFGGDGGDVDRCSS